MTDDEFELNEVTIELTVGFKYCTIGRHFTLSDKFATFFIDGWLRKLFREVTTYIIDNVWEDQMLAIGYTIHPHTPLPTNPISRTVLNAVVQAGESIDFAPYIGKFLTKARYLQKYEGYPLNVAAITFSSSNYTYIFHGNTRTDGNVVSPRHIVINVPGGFNSVSISTNTNIDNRIETNSGDPITTNAGTPILLFDIAEATICRMQVVNECTPENPFYVKWVNNMGGYDYFMFKKRQRVKRDLKNVQVSVPFVPDVQASDHNEDVYSYEADNSVVAGAENVNRYEFEVLRGLLLSPRMWWYREDLQKWTRIYIAKGSTQEDTWETMQNVEYEFILPAQNVQI